MKKILIILVLNFIMSCGAFAQSIITLNKENSSAYLNVEHNWFFDGYGEMNEHSVYIKNDLGHDIFLYIFVEQGGFSLMCNDFFIGAIEAGAGSSLGCLVKAGKSASWGNDAVGASVISKGTFTVIPSKAL